jgi:hypothetical protein
MTTVYSGKESISAIVTTLIMHTREMLPERPQERLTVFDNSG